MRILGLAHLREGLDVLLRDVFQAGSGDHPGGGERAGGTATPRPAPRRGHRHPAALEGARLQGGRQSRFAGAWQCLVPHRHQSSSPLTLWARCTVGHCGREAPVT